MKSLITLLIAFAATFGISAQAFNVTFRVDMNEVGAAFTTPEVNGTFNGWCGGCAPMSDPDGDNIWELTIDLAAGFYEYKFAYDSWAGSENLTPGSECTLTTGGFTNRTLDVTGDADLGVVCWGSCVSCSDIMLYDVTFSVNMNDVAAPFTTPEVNGSWDGWCGGCTPLSDPDGDGVWSTTKTLEAGFYEYKFAYDSWAGDESLTPGDPCTITTDIFTNRFVTVDGDVDMGVVCWASCELCEIAGLEQMDLPVTFEDAGVDYGLIGFGGAEASSIVTDPTDATNTVAMVTKSATAELWAGTTITNGAGQGFASAVPFTADNTMMSVRVWSPDAGIQVRLKVEDYADPTKSVETEATTTVAGEWETLYFDFSNEAPGTAELNLTYYLNKASIFFNFGVTGAVAGAKTYYFDDVYFVEGGGGSDFAVTFSVDMNEVAAPFTTPEVNGSWDGWCGGCTPLSDPDGDGVWSTTKMLAPGFYEYKFAYDSWSGDESLTPGDPCTITTDIFTNRFVNVSADVDLGVVCWASCDECDAVELAQMDLPVTFEDAGVEYGLIGFGGAEASSIVTDPTDATNTVAMVTKSATAELWAGTTITNGAGQGFASAVPFTADNTMMSVRVWSPDAGIQVRLKVEDYADPTKSVETEATTTVAGEWETLYFDFSNEAPGTAELNLTYYLNKASIFFNFGVTGAVAGAKTYYFDDVNFYVPASCEIPTGLTVTDITSTGATISWSAAAGAEKYAITIADFASGTFQKTQVETNSVTAVSAFAPSTEYAVHVKSICFELGERSEASETVYFTTNPLRLANEWNTVVYPNPTSGLLNIQTELTGDIFVTVSSVSGQTVFTHQMNGNIDQLNLNFLADGLYIVTLANNVDREIFNIAISK
jgi:hypothetical protein